MRHDCFDPARMLLACAAVLAVQLPAMARAQSLDFFTGTYELIGRDAGKAPKLMNRMLRLEPSGAELRVTACGAPDGRLARFGGELPNPMNGEIAGIAVFCSFYSNPDNYAHLTCWGEAGELFSLWPTMQPTEDPLICG